jgi:hypothetical protein
MTIRRGVLALLEAKPDKGTELGAFLDNGRTLAVAEPGTVTWYAFKVSDTTYGIFDTFETDEARQAHLDGEIPRSPRPGRSGPAGQRARHSPRRRHRHEIALTSPHRNACIPMNDDLPPRQEPPGRCGKVPGSAGGFLDGEALSMDPTALLPFQWTETFGPAELGIKRWLRLASPRSSFSSNGYQSAGPLIAASSPVKSSEHGPQALRWAAIPG